MIEFENHHWLPKFWVKNFTDDDGRVYFFDLKSKKIGKSPPKHVGSRANFNVLLVDGKPVSFEHQFELIETAAAPAMKSLCATGSAAALDEKQKFALSKLFAAQAFRSEAYRAGLEKGAGFYQHGETLKMHFSDLQRFTEMLFVRPWALMITPIDNPFLLGDSPLVLQDTVNPQKANEVGLDMPSVEALVPISPCYAVYMPSLEVGKEISDGYMQALRIKALQLAGADHKVARDGEESRLATKILTNSTNLYRALFHGDPLEVKPENVINLNAMQCFWASQKVFSHQRDFSFVRTVLAKTPEAAEVKPIRLVRIPPDR